MSNCTTQVSKHLKFKLQKFNYGLNSDPYTCPQTFLSSYSAFEISFSYYLCTLSSYPSSTD